MGTPRNIITEFHPYDQTRAGYKRRYSRLNTAVPRAVQIAMQDGHVGDVIEVYHAETGLAIGAIKVLSSGKLDIWWIFGD